MSRKPVRKPPCPVHPYKARFPRATAATYAAGQLSKKLGKTFTPFECVNCGDWHLTTHPRGEKNERTMRR